MSAPSLATAPPALRAPGAETGGQLVDRYGRRARDLRLSITDKCNLRCTYCMPAQGLEWLKNEQLLSLEELVRLARIGVERLGIERIRITGGEPLLRRDLEQLVAALAQLRTHAGVKPDLALTTNGLGLDRRAAQLRSAGLDRVNVSLDSIDASIYATTTRRNRFADALRGIQAAAAVGLQPIKVNAVAMADTIEQVAPSLLDKSLREGWQLRFIEHMPLGAQAWSRQAIVSAQRILDIFATNGFELTELGRPDRRPAQLWQVAPTPTRPGGTVGIIASITRPFCDDCDRTRLTADGQLMTCLFAQAETDLRALLRGGASDEEIASTWQQATWFKPLAHGRDAGPNAQPLNLTRRSMSTIGG